MRKREKENHGIVFGPNGQGHVYKPVPYHSYKAAKRKDKTRWVDDAKGLYAILNQGKNLLGQTGERLAFFPIPPNAQDAWHGYPTNSQYIGDELVEHWYSINVISKGIYRKLLKHIL